VVVQLASTGDGTCTIVSVSVVEMPDPRMFLPQGDLFATEWIDGTPTQRAWSHIVFGPPPAGTPIATDAPMGTAIPASTPTDPMAMPAVSALPHIGARVDRDRPGAPRGNDMPGVTSWLAGAILLGSGAIIP
jgi:hypothetical protein